MDVVVINSENSSLWPQTRPFSAECTVDLAESSEIRLVGCGWVITGLIVRHPFSLPQFRGLYWPLVRDRLLGFLAKMCACRGATSN
jgi:hypothetical protein